MVVFLMVFFISVSASYCTFEKLFCLFTWKKIKTNQNGTQNLCHLPEPEHVLGFTHRVARRDSAVRNPSWSNLKGTFRRKQETKANCCLDNLSHLASTFSFDWVEDLVLSRLLNRLKKKTISPWTKKPGAIICMCRNAEVEGKWCKSQSEVLQLLSKCHQIWERAAENFNFILFPVALGPQVDFNLF